MKQTPQRFWQIFFELYEELPRQGPGSRTCTAKALSLCSDLPPEPVILDLGCGSGCQTLHLAELTTGSILAVDNHAPFITRLKAVLDRRGLSPRVQARVGDMARLDLPPESFDLMWSEGALYSIGIENAVQICCGLLRPGGCLAFTDAVWRVENPPQEIKKSFDLDYPAMGRAEDVERVIVNSGFNQIGRFTLPDEAWWKDFYTPMERRIAELRSSYADDAEVMAILDQLGREPELHRRYSHCYAYEFFVVRKST